MKILIGADIVPTISNQIAFENAQMEDIIDDKLLAVLKSVNYRIFNLEVPLTNTNTPIKKCGPNLIASTESVVGLKQLQIDFLTLANNHILDQGEQGLWSTIEQLDRMHIAYAGVGRTSVEAAKPYIVELGQKKLGIYCCAEHEFSIVNDKQAGANPFDPLESLDHIALLKQQCDYVICLYHGGREHYRYPSPNLQRTCRKIVDKGADLVICQHTHCIGCEEKWKDGTIVYGQGNFLFDGSDNEFCQTSVLICIDLETYAIEYVPLKKNGNGIILATGVDAETILNEMNHRSHQIQEQGFVEAKYAEFASNIITHYLSSHTMITSNLLFIIVNKLSGHKLGKFITRKMIKKRRFAFINQFECEALRELILKGLEVSYK